MKTYKIEVKEVLARVIEVEANTIEEAKEKVEVMYTEEDIVLDYNDLIDTEFIEMED